MRISWSPLQARRPVVDDEVLAVHHLGAVRVLDAVVIGFAEHAAGDRKLEQQSVGLFLPIWHPVEHLPRHVGADAIRPLTLLPIGIGTEHSPFDEIRTVDDCRIGPGLELDRGDRQQRELDVRRLGPREVLLLPNLHRHVEPLTVAAEPVLAALLVDLNIADDLLTDAGQHAVRKKVGEVDVGLENFIERQRFKACRNLFARLSFILNDRCGGHQSSTAG